MINNTKYALISCLVILFFGLSANANAGKIKLLIAPGSLSVGSNIVSGASARSMATKEQGKTGYAITLDLGPNANKLALDFYFGATDYTIPLPRIPSGVRTTSASCPEIQDATFAFTSSSFLVGWRWHSRSGIYFGLGGLFFDPNVVRTCDGPNGVVRTLFDYSETASPALMMGYDFKFKGGFVMGLNFMRSYPILIKGKTTDTQMAVEDKDFYMNFLALSLGYAW